MADINARWLQESVAAPGDRIIGLRMGNDSVAVKTRRSAAQTRDNIWKSISAVKAALLATTALASCTIALDTAGAGGFAIREQSAQFQGSSFAGNAAGGGLSSMF